MKQAASGDGQHEKCRQVGKLFHPGFRGAPHTYISRHNHATSVGANEALKI